MPDFKDIPLRPMTGLFDTLSSADEIGFGNWRVVKNCPTRSTRNRVRGGGWRRLFAEDEDYNNQDLHDQLTDRLAFYDSYSDTASGGGGLSGYGYPYFSPSYIVDGATVFPDAAGPYAPVYIGDHQSGFYNGCPIFYPSVGYPYELIPSFVNTTGARAHWRFDAIAGTTDDLFGGLNLTNFNPEITADAVLGNALEFDTSEWIQSSNAAFATGDIRFGYAGWVRFDATGGSDKHILGKWGSASNRQYRLYVTGGTIRFEVSSNGTATANVTSAHLPTVGDWTFIACWHDPVLNTINIKIDNFATESTSHSGGVFAGGSSNFTFGLDEAASLALFEGAVDSWTFWKNAFPTETELVAIYNSSLGIDYPFSLGVPNTGFPFYYQYSFVYASCPVAYPDEIVEGYPYGARFPLYDPLFNYDYEYCGTVLNTRFGCREAVTLLSDIITSTSRKLIAGTMSRIYELNQSSGNWRILADGLGSASYSEEQCGCNTRRSMVAKQGEFLMHTNNFDPPSIYQLGTQASTCDLNPMQPITDFIALGIQRAGGVVTWKGFTIWFDITENGERNGGRVIWSDFEAPDSYIEGDTSFAGQATVAVGATILNAAPLANWLILYTDAGIIRVTLVGGEDVFNFETIYTGGKALKYKFSLINAGDHHIYLGEDDIYRFTQFDTRPVNAVWLTKAGGMIFNGITEDDASYDSINPDACDLVTGGWNELTQEAYLSWPTGENICPNVTLRLNTKFNAADIVDHGFTAFLTFRKDERPTVGQWMEDIGICPRGTVVTPDFKEGEICTEGNEVENPPTSIRNETEDPNLPVDPDSLCARLSGQTLDDFCQDCASASKFIMASATDFTLKQAEDNTYYREMLGGNVEAYDSYTCASEFYTNVGYDSVMQSGAQAFKSEDEKMIRQIRVEAEPYDQATPSSLECEVGYAPTPNCFLWKAARPKDFECQTERTTEQHLAAKSRPDAQFTYPVFRAGVYLAFRFRIGGIGGGGKFSAVHQSVKGWGQPESP